MIALKAYGSDSNGTGASAFVGIPVPVGVENGDIAIVGIAIPSGVTVTPPSSDWLPIAQTDPTQFGIVAFWTTVLNAPANWVFALSSSVVASGVAAVYAGTDPFIPVEAFTAELTGAGFLKNVGGVTSSLANEESVLFLAMAGNGTFTPSSDYLELATSQHSSATIDVQHKAIGSPGSQAAFTAASSISAVGASLVIVLAPSYGTLSYQDVYDRIFAALPAGLDDLLDFSPTGDFYRLFWVFASIAKVYAFDLIDLMRQEVVPFLSRYKLPDWERVFGMQANRVTRTGTIPQRQTQVLAAWRAAAQKSASFSTVQAVLGPLFGYNPTTPVQIIEADRSALTAEHSYFPAADTVLTHGTTQTITIQVTDGGKVADMGAQLYLAFSGSDLAGYTFVLTAPDQRSATWTGTWSSVPFILFAPSLAGAKIQGNWTLAVTNPSATDNTLYSGSFLFVEGIARGQETAGAIFDWGVYADPAHLGENGSGANFQEAMRAIAKMTHSHTHSRLLLSLWPWPAETTGIHAAVPGRCVPSSRTV